MRKLLLAAAALALLAGCDGTPLAARKFGGTTKIDLPVNQKLVNVTWKDNDNSPPSLWILTRPMRKAGDTTRSASLFDDFAETYTFKEKSTFGVIEGTVIIVEHGGQ